jgi:hypothetical protein
LPAHRRSAPRGGTTSWRRMADLRGHRGAVSSGRPHRLLPLALGLGLLGVGVLAGPSVVGNGWRSAPDPDQRERITLAAVPADTPELGLVYAGLEPAKEGSACAGAYELVDPEICTHGPDAAPPGLRVSRGVSPVTGAAAEPRTPVRESGKAPSDAEIIRDEGGTAPAPGQPGLVPDAAPGEADFVMGSHDVACEGDGRAGKRVQVLYLHEFGTTSRYADYLGSIRTWSAGIDGIIDASAGETGGSRHLRFVTTPQCRVDVAEVQVQKGALASFSSNTTALDKLGYNRTDRKYLIFADANVYCGIGTFIADRRPGAGNRNNGGPSYGRVDAGCWNPVVATHELARMLGALLENSPNASGNGHCTDGNDIFCSRESGGARVRAVCVDKKQAQRLDCNHDDYFSTAPKPGSYLAQNWNIAQNEFLLRSDGGDDVPAEAVTAPAGTGQPVDRSAEPVQAVLEVRDVTSTSVRLSWSAAESHASYDVAVDGVTIASTTSTRARLIGLKPDTAYKVTVTDPDRKYTARADAQTAPAARPAQDSWFVMTNSLTGGAADLYAARSADGTPIVQNGAEGGAQQQWKLVPAGDGSVSLQSKATGKCMAPQDGNPAAGIPLVQAGCAPGDSRQRFMVEHTDRGFSLRSATATGLVVGVGSQRFGAHRLLVLQESDRTRHQSWTALPG